LWLKGVAETSFNEVLGVKISRNFPFASLTRVMRLF
jgi:hypothetical protein